MTEIDWSWIVISCLSRITTSRRVKIIDAHFWQNPFHDAAGKVCHNSHPLIFRRPPSRHYSMMKQFSAPNFDQKTLQDTHTLVLLDFLEIIILFYLGVVAPYRSKDSASSGCQMDFLIFYYMTRVENWASARDH